MTSKDKPVKESGIRERIPTPEVKLISNEIPGILAHNASKSANPVEYKLDDMKFSVKFEYYAKKMTGGEGIYDTIPSESDLKEAGSIVFKVMGLHNGLIGQKETQLEITEGRIISTPDREEENLMKFQKAVLNLGRLN
ncbi:MAG: hypothetical protein ACYCSG_03235 [Thermoplasmataceae archaeon]